MRALTGRLFGPLLAWALALAPAAVARAEVRPLGLLGASVAGPVLAPHAGVGWGPGFSGAFALAFDRWLLPSLRIDALTLASGTAPPDDPAALRHGSLDVIASLALRLRPRGLFFPHEPHAASCVWAEVAAGVDGTTPDAGWALQAAVGFFFEVGDVDLGPSVRVLHLLTPEGERVILALGLELVPVDRP